MKNPPPPASTCKLKASVYYCEGMCWCAYLKSFDILTESILAKWKQKWLEELQRGQKKIDQGMGTKEWLLVINTVSEGKEAEEGKLRGGQWLQCCS